MERIDPQKYHEGNEYQKLELIIKSWPFTDPENILKVLKEKGVMIPHLYWMEDEDFKKLFPKDMIRDRIEIRKFWDIFWFEANSKVGRNETVESKKDIYDAVDKMIADQK